MLALLSTACVHRVSLGFAAGVCGICMHVVWDKRALRRTRGDSFSCWLAFYTRHIASSRDVATSLICALPLLRPCRQEGDCM